MASTGTYTGDESKTPPRIWRFANVTFDESRWELSVDGLPVDVEPRPLELLRRLLRYAGEVVDKRELLDALYGHTHITEAALTNAVTKLRRALRDTDQSLIATVHRVGYRIAVPVRSEDVRGAVASPQTYSTGMSVAGREHWVLQRALGVHRSAEVWLAAHAKTGEQRVFKFSLDGRGLSALKREVTLYRVLRETLGEREDFATILDWHLAEAPCYLECAWGGVNLAEWAHNDPRFRAMPQAQRIELIAGIADTVAAAHSAGVLHKDLKPSNVLVYIDSDDQPRTRVTDFGSGRLMMPEQLARIGITQLGFTQTQGVSSDSGSGTPLYLAPEVMAGESPTSQSDVYALGVMLYQATIGDFRRPLAAGWEADIADPLLQEDIQLAANGTPERRLASAEALAVRLRTLDARRAAAMEAQRILQRAEVAEREIRALRARRKLAIATSVALGLGTVVSAGLLLKARNAEQRASAQAARAEAVNHFLLDDVLFTINSGEHPVKDLTVTQLLDEARPKVLTRFKMDPAGETDLHLALARAYRQLAADDRALSEYALAVDRAPVATDADTLKLLLRTEAGFIGLLMEDSRLRDEIPRMDRLLAQGNSELAPDDPDLLALKLEQMRARAYQGLWQQSLLLGEVLLKQLHGRTASDPLLNRTEQLYTAQLLTAGRYAEAESLCAQRLSKLDAAKLSEQRFRISTLGLLGSALARQGKHQQALSALTEALELGRQWYPNSSGLLLSVEYQYAEVLMLSGAPQQAENIVAQLTDESDPAPIALHIMGRSELQLGNLRAAEQRFARLIAEYPSYADASHPELIEARLDLAETRLALKQREQARLVFSEIPPAALQDYGDHHPLTLRYQALEHQFSIQQDRDIGPLSVATKHPLTPH